MPLGPWSFKFRDFNYFNYGWGYTMPDWPGPQLWDSPELVTPAEKASGSWARRIFVQLCVMHQLWSFLDQESLRSVIQALVVSLLDYCNVLYKGLLLKNIQKFQLRRVWQRRQFLVARWCQCYTSTSQSALAGSLLPDTIHSVKPSMAWVQIIWGTISPQSTDLSYPCWQRRHATGPIGQGILTGRVQEKGPLCCGSCPLEHLILWGEIDSHSFDLL